MSTPATAGSAPLAVSLAGVTGFTDGVGVSVVSGVFVSFMSGNTTSTGVAIGTADGPALLHVAATVPLFVAGVVVGALLMRRPTRRAALVVAAALLLGFLVWRLVSPATDPASTGPLELVDLALLVVPMGVLATTLRSVGPHSVGVGFVTGTLVSLGEALAARDRRAVALYGCLWAAFLLGAALGALAANLVGPWSVLAPVVALAAIAARRRSEPLASSGDE